MGHSLDALMVVKFSPRLHHCGISGAHSELLSEIRLLHWYFRATKERMSSTCGHCGEKAIETTSYGRTHFQNCGKTIGQNKNKKKNPRRVWFMCGRNWWEEGQRAEHLVRGVSISLICNLTSGLWEEWSKCSSGLWSLGSSSSCLCGSPPAGRLRTGHWWTSWWAASWRRTTDERGGVISLWSTGTVVSTGTTGG